MLQNTKNNSLLHSFSNGLTDLYDSGVKLRLGKRVIVSGYYYFPRGVKYSCVSVLFFLYKILEKLVTCMSDGQELAFNW